MPCRPFYLMPDNPAGPHARSQEHGDFLYIACFGTAPEQQGRGLGSQLMRRVLQHADAKDL